MSFKVGQASRLPRGPGRGRRDACPTLGAGRSLGIIRNQEAWRRLAGLVAVLGIGFVTSSGAAERLQSVVHRVVVPDAQTDTNPAKTFRLAGTAVDPEGKPVAGAVVECYEQSSSRWPLGGADMEVKQRATTGADGAFEFRVSRASNCAGGAKAGFGANLGPKP